MSCCSVVVSSIFDACFSEASIVRPRLRSSTVRVESLNSLRRNREYEHPSMTLVFEFFVKVEFTRID